VLDFRKLPEKGIHAILERYSEASRFSFRDLLYSGSPDDPSWGLLSGFILKPMGATNLFRNIQHFHLCCTLASAEVDRVITQLAPTPIRRLDLEGVNYADQWLENLATSGFSSLNSLSLINMITHRSTGRITTKLAQLTQLESLTFRRPLSGGRYGSFYNLLSRLVRLTHLELSYCFIEDETVIAGWTTLTSIKICSTGSSDYVFSTSMDSITGYLTKLRVLEFSKHSSASPLSQFEKATKLTSLEVLDSRGFVFEPSWEWAAKLPKLRLLMLSPRTDSEHGLAHSPELQVVISDLPLPDWLSASSSDFA